MIHSAHSSRSLFALSAGLSLLVHAGLLAAISQWPTAESVNEDPPLVTVTLMPTPSIQPEPGENQAPAPPMKRTEMTRPALPQASTSLPLHPSVAPAASTLALDPQPQPMPVPHVSKTRTLKDHRTTDALLAQRLVKLAKPSTMPAQPSPAHTHHRLPEPAPSIVPSVAATDRSRRPSHALEHTHAPPLQPSRRVLLAQSPRQPGRSRGKVGILRSIPPSYPRIAKEKGWEGTVILRVTVSPGGRADAIQIRKSSGYPVLDEAAVHAVKTWQFRPAYDGTIPLRTRVDIPIHFDLREQVG